MATLHERHQERRDREIDTDPVPEPDWQRIGREARAQRKKAIAAAFPPPGKRPHCCTCQRELEPYRYWQEGAPLKYAYQGNNRFCNLNCGFRWAVQHTT